MGIAWPCRIQSQASFPLHSHSAQIEPAGVLDVDPLGYGPVATPNISENISQKISNERMKDIPSSQITISKNTLESDRCVTRTEALLLVRSELSAFTHHGYGHQHRNGTNATLRALTLS